MIAIDTNVIVRVLLDDDPVQSPIAMKLIAENRVFISLIALVETFWVLRSRRTRERQLLADEIAAFIAVDTVEIELEAWAIWALARYRAGADFADMLLLIAARDCAVFASFDRPLIRLDLPGAPLPVRDLNA